MREERTVWVMKEAQTDQSRKNWSKEPDEPVWRV